VEILYERGRITAEHTIYTGNALFCYALGLYAYSLVKIVTPTFYALGDTKKPVKFSAIVIVLKIAINLALIRKLGFMGLALGTSVASLLNTGLLLNALQHKIGSLSGHAIIPTILRITLASLIMGVAAWKIHDFLSATIGNRNLYEKAASLGISIVAALAVLMLLSYLFKVKEAKTLIEIVTSKFGRSTKVQ
jgi:putative peptidoglycan lipid II flippase